MRSANTGFDDCFHPPRNPTQVRCLHCGKIYESTKIQWVAGPLGEEGAWVCPTAGCDGVGFLCDIWPTDPNWKDEEGQRLSLFAEEEDAEEAGELKGGLELDLGDAKGAGWLGDIG